MDLFSWKNIFYIFLDIRTIWIIELKEVNYVIFDQNFFLSLHL